MPREPQRVKKNVTVDALIGNLTHKLLKRSARNQPPGHGVLRVKSGVRTVHSERILTPAIVHSERILTAATVHSELILTPGAESLLPRYFARFVHVRVDT